MRPQHFGAVTVQKIVELPSLALDRNWLIGNATAEGVEQERSWLGPEFIEPASGRLVISVHSFLVRTPRLTVLVDTCCGNGRHRGPDSPFDRLSTGYLGELERAGVKPDGVDLVFCTHLHVDHVGWNVVERDGRFTPTFPNARYLFNREDFEHRLDCDRRGQGSYATRVAFRECVLPLAEAGLVDFVDPQACIEQDLDHDLALAPLPGHCPGHTGLRIRGGGTEALITGDAIHHPIQLPHPDWYCAADVDPETSSKTRHDLIERYADTGRMLLTGHFAGATAGRIVSRNGLIRFDFVE
jgi:glyoxylase-like metal-dependent hydrolase (beta-lactamase superfamily II)